MAESGLKIISADNLGDAAKKIVAAVKRRVVMAVLVGEDTRLICQDSQVRKAHFIVSRR